MANGQIFEGQAFGPGDTFGDGCIFIGCTFYAKCEFGVGCVFVDCTWTKLDSDEPFSTVGEGATVENGYLDWVEFSGKDVFKNPTIVAVVFGGETVINTVTPVKGKGFDETYCGCLGQQIIGSVSSNHDWCSYKCKPGRYIIGAENSDVGVKITETGNVVTNLPPGGFKG